MALENRDLAILSARFGVARFGASRFGFCPLDVEGASNDEPGEYIWKEHKPSRTDWTLQTPCLICGAQSVASFYADLESGVAPLAVQFTDTSTGGVSFWYWTFGDGTHSYEQNPLHTFPDADTTYTVSLWVSGAGGSDGPATLDIVTDPGIPPPVASFDWAVSSEDVDVDFTDTSTGTVTSWLWDFSVGGNPVSSTDQNPTSLYVLWGVPYTVTLTVTGPAGSDIATTGADFGISGSGSGS